MKLNRLVYGLLGAATVAIPLAYAAGIYEGFPAIDGVLVGNERWAVDTLLSGGQNPQTENITSADIATYLNPSQLDKFSNVPVGSVAYGSFGTSTTPVAGTIYWTSIVIPKTMTLTGIGYLIGGTGGTDSVVVGLYDADGTLVANSALAGVTVGTQNTFQQVAFTATEDVTPGLYYIGVQMNGTTARLRTVAASTFINVLSDSDTGSFGTLTALTPPTTFTADLAPISYVY